MHLNIMAETEKGGMRIPCVGHFSKGIEHEVAVPHLTLFFIVHILFSCVRIKRSSKICWAIALPGTKQIVS